MLLKLDKTVVLVAATKALTQHYADTDNFTEETLQQIVDVLSSKNSKFIQSVFLDEYEYELIEKFLEDV